jgi:hypothetical protein
MKVEMEEVLRCADGSGTPCQFVARGWTIEDSPCRLSSSRP